MILANALSSGTGRWAIAVMIVEGFLAFYVLLPRVRRVVSPWWGGLAGAAALVQAGWLVRPETATVELALFYVFSLIAIVSGGMLITLRNPVHAALSFALVVLSTCGLFLLQAAPFLMAATVIVYAGAIVVTFLFVIMLAQQEGPSDADYRSREPFLACVAGFFLLGTLLYVLQLNYDTGRVDELLDWIRRAKGYQSAAAIDTAMDWTRWQETYVRASAGTTERDRKAMDEQLLKARTQWDEWKEANNAIAMRGALESVEHNLRALLRETRGSLQADASLPLSSFSGLAANVSPAAAEVPRDAQGRVGLPVANLEALGRSLFTDYLLPVELAGTLLLVATIGAIAIAGRREGLR